MKKSVQIAFSIALIILSILSVFYRNELINNIIYSVTIPSFLLALISFFEEIRTYCETTAQYMKLESEHLGDAKIKTANKAVLDYEAGKYPVEFKEGLIPKDIEQILSKGVSDLKNALDYANVQQFCIRISTQMTHFTIVVYVLLFLSLILSPYIVKIISFFDISSIALWSLTLLYISLELKTDICTKIFKIIMRFCREKTAFKHQ